MTTNTAFSVIADGVESHTIPGVYVWLSALPELVTEHEFVELGGRTVRAASRVAPTTAVFDVEITTTTPEETIAARDRLAGLLGGGENTVSLKVLGGIGGDWIWSAIVEEVSRFTRGVWVRGVQCTLTGTVSMLIPDGYATARRTYSVGAGGSVAVTPRGNLSAIVNVEFGPGTNPEVSTGGNGHASYDGVVASGQTLMLDFENRDLYLRYGGVRYRGAAHRVYGSKSIQLPPGKSTTVSVRGAGATVTVIERKA